MVAQVFGEAAPDRERLVSLSRDAWKGTEVRPAPALTLSAHIQLLFVELTFCRRASMDTTRTSPISTAKKRERSRQSRFACKKYLDSEKIFKPGLS
jgi:hypothetical protein